MATHLAEPRTSPGPTHVFERVLVGIDGSDASSEAARQAAILAERYGELRLLGVYPPPRRLGLDPADEFDPDDTRATIERAVAEASDAIGSLAAPAAAVTRGYAWKALT